MTTNIGATGQIQSYGDIVDEYITSGKDQKKYIKNFCS
jgi:hypothetical protein